MKLFSELKVGDQFRLDGGEVIWTRVVGDFSYNCYHSDAPEVQGLCRADNKVIPEKQKVYVIFGNRGEDNHYDMIKVIRDEDIAKLYTNDRNKASNTDPRYYSFHYEEIEVT